jgi:hypothetical protein
MTQLTQEQQRAMMEDFHDPTRRAAEGLVAATSVEAEARATGGGPPRRDRRLHRHRPEGGSRRAQRLHRQRSEGGLSHRA